MSRTPDDGDGRANIRDHAEDLFVSNPASGIYVFHTDEDQEFIRIDIVVDPENHR